MAKKKRRKKIPAKNPQSVPTSYALPIAAGALFGVVATLLMFPSYWFLGSWQPLFTYVVLGISIGLVFDRLVPLLAASATSSAIGGLVFPSVFTSSNYLLWLSSVDREMFHRDIIDKALFIDLIYPSVQRSSFTDQSSALAIAALASISIFAVALGVRWVKRHQALTGICDRLPAWLGRVLRLDQGRSTTVVFSIILSLLLVILLGFAMWESMQPLLERVSVEPEPYMYETDYNVYMRTYYRMKAGDNFYDGYYRSIVENRGIAEGIANTGKLEYLHSPVYVRHPFIFYVWKTFGFGSINGIAFAALLLLLALMFLLAMLFDRLFFPGIGMLLILFLYPYFMQQIGWHNLFLPDMWGSLFVGLSFGLLMSNFISGSVIFGLLAAQSRISDFLWLVSLGVAIGIGVVIKRNRWHHLAGLLAGFAVVITSFMVHWRVVVSTYPNLMCPQPCQLGAGGVPIRWKSLEAVTVSLLQTSNWLMYPYTFFKVQGILAVILGVIFYVLVLSVHRKKMDSHYFLAPLVFILLFIFMTGFNTTGSQYWGQQYLPLSILGTAGLLLLPVKYLLSASERRS